MCPLSCKAWGLRIKLKTQQAYLTHCNMTVEPTALWSNYTVVLWVKSLGCPIDARQMRLRYCSRWPHEPKGIFVTLKSGDERINLFSIPHFPSIPGIHVAPQPVLRKSSLAQMNHCKMHFCEYCVASSIHPKLQLRARLFAAPLQALAAAHGRDASKQNAAGVKDSVWSHRHDSAQQLYCTAFRCASDAEDIEQDFWDVQIWRISCIMHFSAMHIF